MTDPSPWKQHAEHKCEHGHFFEVASKKCPRCGTTTIYQYSYEADGYV